MRAILSFFNDERVLIVEAVQRGTLFSVGLSVRRFNVSDICPLGCQWKDICV